MAADNDAAELAAFEQHLDVHGARVERWPPVARKRFEPLLAGQTRARELLVEAQALERLLDRAPMPDPARIEALRDRIVKLAAVEGARIAAPVVHFAARGKRQQPLRRSVQWKLASALAASLIVGIYIGRAPSVVSAVETIAGAVGLPAHQGSAGLALFDDGATDEEDLI